MMTVAEVLEQAKTLTPEERKELVKLLIDTLDVQPQTISSGDDHWGRKLLQLLDTLEPLELIHPEIEDPVAWVKHIREEPSTTA
ncbi:MAG: hypothetical protein OHK0046_49540 [Anaerolineae bacterium]